MRNLKLVVNNKNNKLKREIFFVKKELQTILNLYAKMVSNGSWKDYGLSLESKVVSFDVYQRSSEKPVFRVIKKGLDQGTLEELLECDLKKEPFRRMVR